MSRCPAAARACAAREDASLALVAGAPAADEEDALVLSRVLLPELAPRELRDKEREIERVLGL